MLQRCELCPRRCGADRAAGRRGYCHAGNRAQVYRFGPHAGEEPPVSGTRGSGTVFFSRCTLRCLYCQNFPWSQQGLGAEYADGELAGVFRTLHAAGCHNWNLVSPTPWLPWIAEAAAQLAGEGVRLPFVYNTSGFERVETLETFAQLGDVYLADLRYADPATAAEASDAPDYVRVAREALRWMWRARGALRTDAGGVAVSGVICRILVLPGRSAEAIANLRWLAETVGTDIAVSLMSQYVPTHRATARDGWNRRVTPAEYDGVRDEMEQLGFTEGWIQEREAETSPELIGYRMPAGGTDESEDRRIA
jgi:putative pyruvate formate lyase activating enzyme